MKPSINSEDVGVGVAVYIFQYLLFVGVGLSSWLLTNGLFIEIGSFVENTPEENSIASYLSVAIQVGNVLSVVYLLGKHFFSLR